MVDPAVGALGPKGIGGTASIGKLENVDISKPDGKIRFSQSLLFLNSAEMDAIIGKLKGWNKKGPLVLSLPKMKTLPPALPKSSV